MELGLGTIVYALSGIPMKEYIRKIGDFGFKYIDVLAAGLYNPSFYSEDVQHSVYEEMKKYDMRASSVITCASGNLASDDPSEREEALEQLKLAGNLVKNLGGKQVLVGKGVGNMDFHLSREKAEANAVEVIREYADWAGERDLLVTFELEPEFLHVCNGIASMRTLIDRIGRPNIYANVDFGHLNIIREGPEMIGLLKDKIIHAHISDNDGLAHTNSVIGDGSTDINAFLMKMVELGVDEVARAAGDVAVAGIEVGAPGEVVEDPDLRVTKSLGSILERCPYFRAAVK